MGSSADFNIAVAPSPPGALVDRVNLNIIGLPRGLKAQFTPSSEYPPFNSTLRLTATRDVIPGSYRLTIIGTTLDRVYNETLGDVVTLTVAHNTSIGVVIPTPDFNVTVEPSSIIIYPGEDGLINVTASSINGFNRSITLSASSVPGFTVTFTPSTLTPIPGMPATSTARIHVDEDVTAGIYDVVVAGRGGNLTHSDVVSVCVPDFTIDASVSSLTATIGSTRTLTVTLTSLYGFNRTVELLPPEEWDAGIPGVVVTYQPQAVRPEPGAPATSTVYVNVTPSASPGTYDLYLIGEAGAREHFCMVTLRIPEPSFTLSVSPSSLTVNFNSSGVFNINVTSINGFSSPVDLSVTHIPGVDAVFNPSTVTPPIGGVASSILTLNISDEAEPGTYRLEITGEADGLSDSADATLRIADFSLSISPTSVTIPIGSTGSVTVTATSISGFNTPIDLDVSGLPSGVSASFDSETITPPVDGSSSSTLLLNVSSDAEPGVYTLTIIGSSSGSILRHIAHLSLTIPTPPPAPDFTLDLSETTVKIKQGESANITVRITPLHGFSESVTLSAVTPSGVTASFNSTVISPSQNASMLTLRIAEDAPSGIYTVDIWGESAHLSHSRSIQVIVPDFSLSPSTSTMRLKVGESGTLSLTATSINGYEGCISLSADAPRGIDVDFQWDDLCLTPGGVNSSSVTISVASDVSPGVYMVNITGVGSPRREVSLTVEVTDFDLAVSNSHPTILIGSSEILGVDVLSLGGFSQPVQLSVQNLPSGFTAVLDRETLTPPSGGSDSTSLTLTVSRDASPGVHTITLRGVCGSLVREVDINVTVPQPSFTLSLYPSSIIAVAGGEASSTITVTSVNNFEDSVTLTVNSSLPGLVAVFEDNPVTPPSGGSTSTTLTLQIPSNATPGLYNITIGAEASGVGKETAYLALRVRPPPPKPDYTVSVDPSSLSTVPGFYASSVVTVTSLNGFNRTVHLFLSAPSGIVASFSPSSVTPPINGSATSTLMLNVSDAMTPGTYPLTLTAAVGNASKTQQIMLQVMDYTVSVIPSSVTVEVGGSTTLDVYVTSINGFNSPIYLSAEVEGAEVTSTFTPNPVTPTADAPGHSTWTLTVDEDSPYGTFNVILNATYLIGEDVASIRSTNVTLTIPEPSFTLTPSTSSLTINLNSSRSLTLTATSINGFTSPIQLTAAAAQGLNVTFNPDVITPPRGASASSTVTITALPNATIGRHYIEVNGTSGGRIESIVIAVDVADFNLEPSRPRISVRTGTGASLGLEVESLQGFNSPVTLSALAPAGVSITFSPNPVTPPVNGSIASIMDIYVAPDADTNVSYTITILGVSDGLSHSCNFTLRIPPPPREADFTLSASPTAVTLPIGSSTGVTLTIESLYNFSSPVTLSASTIPGVSTSFSLNPVTPPPNDAATSLLTLEASEAAEPGLYTLTITGVGDDKVHTVNITVTIPDFALTVSQALISLGAGESGGATVTVSSLHGFNEPVSLSAVNLPVGVSASFTPSTVIPPADGSASSTLTVTVDPATPAGVHTITIVGESSSMSHSLNITLSIMDFNITSEPITLVRGSTNTTTVILHSRNGFSGSIALDVEGLPPGVSAVFTPNPVSLMGEASSTLTLTAADTASIGVHNVTIIASGATMNRTATLTITIPQPSFTLTSDPSQVTIGVESVGGASIIIESIRGWSDAIDLTVTAYDEEGAVTDEISASITPTRVTPPTGGSTSASLTITTTNFTGTYNLTITGVGPGLTRSATVTVIVPDTLNATTVENPEAVNETAPLELNGTYTGSGLRGVYLILTDISGTTYLAIGEVEPMEGTHLDVALRNLYYNETAGIGYLSLGQFYELTNANSTATLRGRVRIYYIEEVLNQVGLDPSRISIYYYDADEGLWRPLPTRLNETGGYVEADVTHLSLWSIFASNYPPSKVAGLRVTDEHDGRLRLRWDAATDDIGVDHYNIYRNGTLIATATGTSYLDTDLTNYRRYTYQVSAVDVAGLEGELSDPVSGTPTPSAPPAPPPIFVPPAAANQPPIAVAGPDQTVFVNRTVHFDASASRDPDGSIVSYEWDFGDGATATGVKVTHTYTSTGVYTVTLTVTDDQGATDTDSCIVTVVKPPITPIKGLDEGVPANATNFLVDALDEADMRAWLNTTKPTTLSILRYPENPHPEAPLPKNALPKFIDIAVGNASAIQWPIYVEVHYTDEEVAGRDESRLALYYYKNGAWHRCRETGVHPDGNVVWARMYRDELVGTPVVVAEIPLPASFQLSGLIITPESVKPGEEVSISVTVTNVGDEGGECEVALKIEGVVVDSQMVTLSGGESTTVTFKVSEEAEGTYHVEVDGLTGSFTVKAPAMPKPAEFKLSALSVTPKEVKPGEEVTVTVTISNVGEESGSRKVEVKLDGVVVDSKTVTLSGGKSTTLTFKLSSEAEGDHIVEVDGLTATFTVVKPPRPIPWLWITVAVVIAVAVIVAVYITFRRRNRPTLE